MQGGPLHCSSSAPMANKTRSQLAAQTCAVRKESPLKKRLKLFGGLSGSKVLENEETNHPCELEGTGMGGKLPPDRSSAPSLRCGTFLAVLLLQKVRKV